MKTYFLVLTNSDQICCIIKKIINTYKDTEMVWELPCVSNSFTWTKLRWSWCKHHNTLIAERIRKSNLNQKESQGYLISKHSRVQTFGLQILVPGVMVYKIRDSSDSCPRHLRINSCLQASRVNSRKCLGLGLRLQNEI